MVISGEITKVILLFIIIVTVGYNSVQHALPLVKYIVSHQWLCNENSLTILLQWNKKKVA